MTETAMTPERLNELEMLASNSDYPRAELARPDLLEIFKLLRASQARESALRDAGRQALTLMIAHVPEADKRGDVAIAAMERALSAPVEKETTK